MLRIGICDDQLEAREALRFQIEKVIDEDKEQIVYEFSSGNVAANWLQSHPGEIDLLFLDVEMTGLNGMETAAKIRTFNQDLLIVFVTNYTDYVFEGYQVDALDYIIKPASLKRVEKVIERVRTLILKQYTSFFTFKNADGNYRIPYSAIQYFYSEKRKVFLVTGDREYDFYDQLNHIEEELEDEFVRIHQRYLVNPKYVSHIGSSSVSIENQELPVSRSLKDAATRRLALSLFGGSIS